MSDNLIEVLFVPLGAAIVTAAMVVVVLLIARKEAKEAAKTTHQADETLERTMRRAS